MTDANTITAKVVSLAKYRKQPITANTDVNFPAVVSSQEEFAPEVKGAPHNISNNINVDKILHRLVSVESTVDRVLLVFANSMEQQGYDLESPRVAKDVGFLFETMMAVLLRTFGLNHPLHELMDDETLLLSDEELEELEAASGGDGPEAA